MIKSKNVISWILDSRPLAVSFALVIDRRRLTRASRGIPFDRSRCAGHRKPIVARLRKFPDQDAAEMTCDQPTQRLARQVVIDRSFPC